MPYEGGTDPTTGTIKIGMDAFTTPGWLAATIFHEQIHNLQFREHRLYNDGDPYNDSIGENLNELEAFRATLVEADRFGLSSSEIEELENRRDKYQEELDELLNTR